MSRITLDSEQVLAIASQISSDNQSLKDLLQESQGTLNALDAYWTGAAAEATRSAYGSFATKFFQQYYEILDQYVKFLRTNVSAQYEETEATNAKLADSFM